MTSFRPAVRRIHARPAAAISVEDIFGFQREMSPFEHASFGRCGFIVAEPVPAGEVKRALRRGNKQRRAYLLRRQAAAWQKRRAA